jgi:hypothetical protein
VRIGRKVAYGANPETVPVAKFALKPIGAFATILVDPFEGNGLQPDRIIMPDGGEPLLGFPRLSLVRYYISECGLVLGLSWVPPAGTPPQPPMGGGLWLSEMPDRVPARLSPNFGAFSQCAWLWSPTALAALPGPQEQFCCDQSLLRIG